MDATATRICGSGHSLLQKSVLLSAVLLALRVVMMVLTVRLALWVVMTVLLVLLQPKEVMMGLLVLLRPRPMAVVLVTLSQLQLLIQILDFLAKGSSPVFPCFCYSFLLH